jgi:uncharacterized repeat protein (TIGR01451 family)
MNRLSIKKICAVTALLVITCGTAGWAAPAEDPLKLVSSAEKEVTTVTKEGKTEVTRTPLKKVVPGDVVVYTNRYENNGSKPADDAVISNPVPQHMTYVDGSAFGAGAAITFSIDKGKTFDVPEKLTKTEKGKKRAARADEYTNIRWTVKSIPPGKEGDVGFKARVK